MHVREMQASETTQVLELMRRLWPDCDDTTIIDDVVFVVARETGLGGFLAARWRSYAEGCESQPVAYVEGWWIDEDLRRQGWGRALMAAAEAWARAGGSRELASDARIDNELGVRAHRELGFEEVGRAVAFRKRLD
jgi:aminoglycoside 6'-N-acetyltransferase I